MDLQPERNAINEVANQIEAIPVKMELFTARNESPEEVCLEEVSNSDCYIGIFGDRFGFVPPEDNPDRLSVTAIEFEKARELKIPTLIFVRRVDAERDVELQDFLKRITNFKKGVFRKTFNGTDELKYWVLASLVRYLSRKTDKKEQKNKLEQLVHAESFYRQYIRKTCEYVDFKGIHQLRRVVQLKLDDIYVTMKLEKLLSIRDESLEVSPAELPIFGVEIASPRLSPFAGALGRKRFKPSTNIGCERGGLANTEVNQIELKSALSSNRKLVILGGPGSGKTTSLRHLAGDLVREKDSNLLPILIPLREYVRYAKGETNPSILGYLESYFEAHGLGLPDDFFTRYLYSGGCVVMFDGLDEVLREQDRIEVASQIEQFAACCGLENTIIVTSRIPSYRLAQISGFEHYGVRRMDLPQISLFVSKWFKVLEGTEESDEGNKLMSLLSNDSNLLSLSTNPLMLSLICLIGLQGIPMPRKKADLYEMCVRTLLSSWEAKKGFEGVFGDSQRYEIIKKLAFLFLHDRRVTATEYELSSGLEKILREAHPTGEQRISDDIAMLMKNITERSGLLVEKEPGVYGFVHMGLRDYFAALYLAGMDNVQDMFNNLLRSRLHSADYEQTICLCSRCLANQSSSRASILLKAIMSAGTLYEEIVHLDLILAAKCLFSSGMSYGETVQTILNSISAVLREQQKDERHFVGEVFEEMDYELHDDFLSSLLSALPSSFAMDLLSTISYHGIAPEKGKFADVALEVARIEAISASELSRDAASIIGTWAARGSKKALKLAIEIIRNGNEKTALSCAMRIVPLAREDNAVLEDLIDVVSDKDAQVRSHLLLCLYNIAPDKIKALATSLVQEDDIKVRNAARAIFRYSKLTKEEATAKEVTAETKVFKALLERKDKSRISESEANRLIFMDNIPEQELTRGVLELPKIFAVNRVLALRLCQLLGHSTEYPSLVKDLKNLAMNLSKQSTLESRGLLAYLLSEVNILETADDIQLLIELAENKKEYVVARRGAINRLDRAKFLPNDISSRLLNLSDDKDVKSNIFTSLLFRPNIDKKMLIESLAKQAMQRHAESVYLLSLGVRQTYEQPDAS